MSVRDLLLYAKGAGQPYQPPVVITKTYDELDEEERLRSAAISRFRKVLAKAALHEDSAKRFAQIALLLSKLEDISTDDLNGLIELAG